MGLYYTAAFWRDFLKGEGEGTALVSDTFTDANNTPLPAHVMDAGPGWTAGLGTFQIQTNKAAPITVDVPTSEATVLTETAFSDVSVSCDINSAAANGGGVIIRGTDANNCIVLFADRTGGAVSIIRIQGGVQTVLATAVKAYVAGTVVTLTGTARGGTITATVGGTTATATLVTFNAGATLCGLYALKNTAIDHTFDNFTVAKNGNTLSEASVRLIVNNPSLTPNLNWATLTEATFGGYAPQPVVFSAPFSNAAGLTYLPAAAVTFVAADAVTPNSVTGYALVSGSDVGGVDVYAVEMFPAPVQMAIAGDGCTLTPVVTLASDMTGLPGALLIT